jgi:tetratricopeptide (TPR) repeat protein
MQKIILFFLLISGFTVFSQEPEVAYSYYRSGEYEKAISLYEPLHENNPVRQDYFKYLLTCYQQTEDYKSAEKLIRKQQKTFPNLFNLYVELGYNYQLQKQNEKAEKEYQKALKVIEKNPNYVYAIGQAFKNNSLLDHALESYQKAKKLNPKININVQLAQIYAEKGELEKMFNSYLNLIDVNEKYYPTVQRYIAQFITANPEDETNILFKKLLLKRAQNNPKNAYNRLLGWIYMQQKQYGKALIQEKSVFRRDPKNTLKIAEIGKIAFQNGDYKTSEDAFQFILKNDPDPRAVLEAEDFSIRIRIKNSKTSQELKKTNESFNDLFKKYGFNSNTIRLQLTYADFLTFDLNQPAKAIEVLKESEEFAKTPFIKGAIRIKLADIMVYTGQFNQALILYSQVQTELKNSTLAQTAQFKVAQTSFFKGDFDWAKTQLKVLKTSTSKLIANDALELYLTITNNIAKDSVTRPLELYAKAELLSFQNKNIQAVDTLNIILRKYKGQPVEDDALYRQAELLTEMNEFKKAEENYLKILKINPEGVFVEDACYKLAKLYHKKLNEPEKAKEYYKKIIFEYPTSINVADARKQYRLLRGDPIE